MNLQPLYDIKERLEYAAIAGTGLLGEDFRLQRALESLQPLAAASPVFGRIATGLAKLLEAPAEQRAGQLLDLLALVDAVAYTQAGAGKEGELAPLPTGSGVYRPIPYSQLSPLLEAINGTGGGRMNQIKDEWENHPEFFEDYRVLPALVAHLGESYTELADLYFEILKALGGQVVPLLKEGFDPAGKRDMARRVQLIDALAGADENAWYLRQLPNAKKTVRESLLYALRHQPANAEMLLELCQTEKRDCQLAAHWALARCETSASLPYWREKAKKEPDEVLPYMQLTSTETATTVTAELFLENMAYFRQNPELPLNDQVWQRVNRLLFALQGKAGPQIAECYRQGAALGTALDREATVERSGKVSQEPMAFWCIENTNTRRPFSEALPLALMRSLKINPDSHLVSLAEQLCRQYGGEWAAPAIAGALLTQDSAAALARAKELLRPGKLGLFQSEKKKRQRDILQDALTGIVWEEATDRHAYVLHLSDPATFDRGPRERPAYPPLHELLEIGWYDLLIEMGGFDQQLIPMIRTSDPAVAKRMGEYFSWRATHTNVDILNYIWPLRRCGWSDWKNLILQNTRQRGEVEFFKVDRILRMLPISGPEKADILEAVNDLVQSRKVRAQGRGWTEEQLQRAINQWRVG